MSRITSINPSTNESLGDVETSTSAQIKTAVAAAHQAQSAWQDIGISGRVKYLQNLYQVLSENRAELGEMVSKEMGMPAQLREDLDINSAFHYFDWYLKNTASHLKPEISYSIKSATHTVYYEPTGVAAVIVPWNFPLSNFVWGVVPNLIIGNTVVFKHSEETILFAKLLDQIIKSAGLPQGVFNQVFGDGKIGDQLVHQDIDLICFTGSTKVGQYLYQVAAEKMIKVVLELGGSAAGIVLQDANIETVLEGIDFNRLSNSGQICDGLKRLIVHQSRFDEVVFALKEYIGTKKIGPATDPTTDIGPLVAQRQVELLNSQIEDATSQGAKIIAGGKSPKHLIGAYYQPTIITNIKPTMRLWHEEVFGPVIPVMSYSSNEEAINLANDTQYGLGGYIFGNQKAAEKIALKLKTGMVSINNVTYLEPNSPFGGYKHSGIGREHGKYGLHDLCQVKVVASEK